MTFPNSSLASRNILEALTGGTAADIPDLNDASDVAVTLHTDVMAEDPTANTALGYGDLTGEHANGNGYTTGGLAVVPTLAIVGGVLVWTLAADPSWSSATFSDVHGAVFHDGGPANDPCIAFLHFATAGNSGGGTFRIDLADSPSSFTVFTIDPQP